MRANSEVVARRMDEQVVLVHLGTNRIYTLNPTGARFWDLLESGLDRHAIKTALLAEFEVGETQLDAEIEALVAELSDQGLLVLDANV
jgi:Coenzyme PQQ synthesis protein D (PqqD)